MKTVKIGFAGLSHLGQNSAIVASMKDYAVIAYDDDKEIIDELNKNKTRVKEPELDVLLRKYNKKNIFFTNSIQELEGCEIIYISLDVPTDSAGNSMLDQIYSLVQRITNTVNKNSIIVILCQVPPGFTREIDWPKSKLYYQVETLIFGDAINRAMNPERFIIGKFDGKDSIDQRFKSFLNSFNCPIIEMKYESAELSKISINTYLISSISATNLLANLAEKVDADWSEIVPSLKLDKRIGKYSYLKPGLGFSGGNLERDLETIIKLSKKYDLNSGLINEFINNSKINKNWALERFLKLSPTIKNIAISILGLSYKENTDSIKNSPSLLLINQLLDLGFDNIKAYDPKAADHEVFSKITRVNEMKEALTYTQVLFIMTPWNEFSEISLDQIKSFMKGNVIIDPYGILRGLSLEKEGYKYLIKGRK